MRSILLGGIVDRIDQTEQGLRIIDYKTGRSLRLDFNKFDDFYSREKDDRRKEIFQTLVYSEIYRRMHHVSNIQPSIYKIDTFFGGDFDPSIVYDRQPLNYQSIVQPFTQSLEELLQEIFSTDNCFTQTEKTRKCESCPFNVICRR